MGQDPTEPTQSMWPNKQKIFSIKSDGTGALPTYVSREPYWNLIGLPWEKLKRTQKTSERWSIKTKNTKTTYYTSRGPLFQRSPLLDTQCIQYTCHFIIQITTLRESAYIQTMCGKTERWAGPSTALFQCRLCSVASPRTTQTHICIIHFTLLYFTLLYLLRSLNNSVVHQPSTK